MVATFITLTPYASAVPFAVPLPVHFRPASLILSTLEQPLRHLILFYYVDMRTPTRQSISIDRIQQRL